MMKHILIPIIMGMLTACSGDRKTADEAITSADEKNVTLTPAQLKNAGISTAKLQQQDISSILQLNGKIDVPPQNLVSISVPLGGYLKTTKLLPGMHVKKGEVLAVVEDQQYIQLQQDFLTAKAGLPFLENEYKRQQSLNQSQSSSDKVYQKAESEYRMQRVLIAALAEKLQLAGINSSRISETTISRSINVYSPIDGYVSKVNVNIGKYVSPTEVLFELINPTDIHLSLTVFEKDLDKLFIGQKLTCFTNNQPDKKHPCEIILIGKDLSGERSTEVHCHFDDYDKTLVPGTYMNAEINVKNSRVQVLPTDAIVRFEGKQYIFKALDSARFEMTEVGTGETEQNFTEIIVPVNTDWSTQQFVTSGAYSLLMMLKNKAD